MKEQTKGDYEISICNHNLKLEEYGENFHKFKGGSTYVVGVAKDDSGIPSVSEASVAES